MEGAGAEAEVKRISYFLFAIYFLTLLTYKHIQVRRPPLLMGVVEERTPLQLRAGVRRVERLGRGRRRRRGRLQLRRRRPRGWRAAWRPSARPSAAGGSSPRCAPCCNVTL